MNEQNEKRDRRQIPPRYEPSLEEIARQCELIRDGWCAATRRQRRIVPLVPWEPPAVDVAELIVD